MIVRDKRKEEREVVYQYEDGLKAFIEEVNQDHTPMHDPISFRGESNQIIVEGCFQYTDEYQENIFSFTNIDAQQGCAGDLTMYQPEDL